MALALGIEIGGTKLQVAVSDREDRVLALARGPVDIPQGVAGICRKLVELADEALASAGCARDKLTTVGIGFGGPVDSHAGRVLCSHQVDGWGGFELAAWARSQWGVSALVQNDANAAAWAEWRLGAGQGTRRLFYMTVGSGIGGGWVCDGKLDEGQGLGAAEIGHTWVPDPETGRPAKLEDVCSGWSIGRRFRVALAASAQSSMLRSLATSQRLTARDVGAAAEAGDHLARQILDATTDSLALALGNVVALLNPERIIIGGGVSLMGDCFWEPLRAKVRARGFTSFGDNYALLPAGLGEAVVVRGALSLALLHL